MIARLRCLLGLHRYVIIDTPPPYQLTGLCRCTRCGKVRRLPLFG
jgi:hypothetical protein